MRPGISGARSEIAWAAAAILLFSGAGLLVWAKVTPWHSNSDAYFAALDAIKAQADAENPDFDALSRAFFANQHRYATRKWLYADIGYVLVAWSALAVLIAGVVREASWRRLIRTQTGVQPLLITAVLACALLPVSLLAGDLHAIGRWQIPYWADSIDIPIMRAETTCVFLVPAILLYALTPLLKRPAPQQPLLVITRAPHWPAALITLLYLPPLALAGLLTADAFSPGGWASSANGALLAWLMLNARAMAIGQRRSAVIQG
jgi:hypothetical protein